MLQKQLPLRFKNTGTLLAVLSNLFFIDQLLNVNMLVPWQETAVLSSWFPKVNATIFGVEILVPYQLSSVDSSPVWAAQWPRGNKVRLLLCSLGLNPEPIVYRSANFVTSQVCHLYTVNASKSQHMVPCCKDTGTTNRNGCSRQRVPWKKKHHPGCRKAGIVSAVPSGWYPDGKPLVWCVTKTVVLVSWFPGTETLVTLFTVPSTWFCIDKTL